MKTILVFSLLILAASAFEKSALTPEQLQKMMDIIKVCMVDSGATDDMIERAFAGDFPDDPKFKEQMLCVGKKAGLADEAGQCIKEEIKKEMMAELADEARVGDIVEKCCDEKATTPQETVFQSSKCLFKEMHAK